MNRYDRSRSRRMSKAFSNDSDRMRRHHTSKSYSDRRYITIRSLIVELKGSDLSLWQIKNPLNKIILNPRIAKVFSISKTKDCKRVNKIKLINVLQRALRSIICQNQLVFKVPLYRITMKFKLQKKMY